MNAPDVRDRLSQKGADVETLRLAREALPLIVSRLKEKDQAHGRALATIQVAIFEGMLWALKEMRQ